MPLTAEDIDKHRRTSEVANPSNIVRIAEEAMRSRGQFLPGDRVHADRIINPGPGTVVVTHTAPHYTAVTINMDSGERAVVEASRVSRCKVPAPKPPSLRRIRKREQITA
jgi:hypothetical protein